MVLNQKEFQSIVIEEIKEIKKDIHILHLDMAKNLNGFTPGL